jgi:histidine ammonia-lyase
VTEIIDITAGALDLSHMRTIERNPVEVRLAGDWQTNVNAAADVVDRVVTEERSVYGINTGFGLLAHESISVDQVRELQVRLVRSHCAGTGFLLSEETVRLIMALKVTSLARGFSGVRVTTVELLLAMLARGVIPVIPAKGSVGASGDLAPLAHMSSVMIGEGEAFIEGERMPGVAALSKAGLSQYTCKPRKVWHC